MASVSTTRFIVPHSLTPISTKLHSKFHYLNFSTLFHSQISEHKYGSCFLVNKPSRYSRYGKRDLAVYNSILSGAPLPSGPPSDSWKSWILGAVITIILPFFSHRWGPLFQITKKVEGVVETIDHVAEVIEEVAEEVEKVADKVGDQLPEGGKLRDALEFIEDAARETAKAAHLADEILDKVEEVENEMEAFMEPVNDQAKEATK